MELILIIFLICIICGACGSSYSTKKDKLQEELLQIQIDEIKARLKE